MRRVGTVLLAVFCAVLVARAEPIKVGEDIVKRYESPHPYAAAAEGSTDLVWRDVITFTGASYVAPHFSRFHLADGDYVIVRSPDGSRSWRFEKLGRGDLGESPEGFWGIHIAGDTAIVELHGKVGGGYGYTIDRFARGYRQEEMVGLGPEAICGAEDSNWAKCYQVSEPVIYDKSRAVARILIAGSSLCTAWLIGNAGHVITNHHCITSAADAMNTNYEFMAEGATCTTDCSAQLSCPGTIVATTATLVQTDVDLDYTVVLLPTNVTPTYGFLKLRQTASFDNERIYLPGHPAAKGKRIAVFSTDPSDQSGFCEITNHTVNPAPNCIPTATQLDIGYMCDTEGGSSGSPVIAYSDHKVVALHHCAGCPNSGVQIPNVIASLGANLPPGAVFDPAGTVALNKAKYGCSAVISIEVKDDNLVGAGTQNVTIHSTTEPANETVSLTENPASSGKFTGTIPTTTAAPVNGDGQLSVTDGDTITVTYHDLDSDGSGTPADRTANALVDCVPPVITNVQSINVTGNSADVTYDTNEPADSLVTYGLAASPPPTLTAPSAALVTSHSVHLTGLLPCRSYIFKVAATDAAGNGAQNDNGGNYYAFTTGANTNPTYASASVPVPIPDNNPAGATATINVSDVNTIQKVTVKINIPHTFDGDLVISLTGPGGQTVSLANRRGSSGDNYTDTVFDDAAATAISAGAAPFAGSFRPEQPLTAYNGLSPAGTWTLKVVDAANLDTGTINKFELTFTYPPQACGPYVRHQSHTVADACNGTGSGGNNNVVDPGEDLTIPVVLVNTGTDTASGVSATLTSPTPGVSITQGSASYGTLNAGQSASGSASYVVHVADTVPCGTLATLQLNVTASQGSWTDSFTVRVGAPVNTTTTYNSTDVPKTIADNTTISSIVNVADTSIVSDVNVGVTLTHTYDGDVGLSLVGPNAATVSLSNHNGLGGDNYTNTVFDDSAATAIASGAPPYTGSFRPDSPLSALNGIAANGTWTLQVNDNASLDTGTLQSWFVQLTVQSGYSCNTCTATVQPPGEVQGLTWTANDALAWTPVASSTGYNVYRGAIGDLPKLYTADPDSCRRLSTPSTSAGGLNTPQDEYSFWLVRAQNAGGEGPAGSGSGGPWIHNSSGACP